MARPLIPFVQNGYYASRNWIPLVKGNGFTTSGGSEQEEVWETASGSIVTLDAVPAPFRQLSVAVEPVQSGTGDPSPENVRPISGWDSVTVNRTGKNLLSSLPSPTGTIGWFCNPDGFLFKAGNIYCFSSADSVLVNSYAIYASDKTTQLAYYGSGQDNKVTYTPAADIIGYPRIYVSGGLTQAIIDTMQLEVGQTRTEYEPYTGTSVTIDLDGTRYGGTLDVVNGKMTVDRANIASYNGEILPGVWISDRDVYSAGATPTTGAQVVYELATPFELTLTPEQISTVQGINNVWSDAGDVTVEYRAR